MGENYQWLIQTLLLALLFGSIIIYFFKSRERIIKAESALQKQQIANLDYERRLLETNLRRMQAQIEPHFLFNTLSNVLGLIDTNPKRGKSMLQSFTHYLRSTLDYTRSESAVLEDEIKIVSSYLDIFQVRMGNRLTYRIDISQDLLNMPFPPMLLQPLVENAIKHGLEPITQGGQILIRAEKSVSSISVIVEDTGQGLKGDSGSGVGITNVQKRLHALYGSRAKLLLEDNHPQGLRATIEVPHDDS
ncbi:sensor histidine kinase [Kaarinaea lacus]